MNKILMIAWILAGISSFVVPPDMEYLNYIDFHTLGLLFCLMAVMAGLSGKAYLDRRWKIDHSCEE